MGLQIEVNKSSNYADFPVGAHIRIKANGLIIKKETGAIKLGIEDPNYTLGRIPQSIVGRFMSGVCDGNKMDIVEIVPTELTLAEVAQEKYINTLVKVKNVQFASSEVGLPLMTMDAAGTYQDTNRTIADANGGSAIIRTDGFFRTTDYKIPNYSGDITFVVSKYNGTYQNIIRSTFDIDMKNPRFATGIVGGTNINYLSAFTVDFEGYGVDNALFPEYINYAFAGNRYWQIKNFNSNNYIQMSANAGSGSYQTMFIVPVDFTNANSLAFNVNVGYHTGNALKVYTTTDYIPLTDIGGATLNDITSSFTIPTTPTNGYGTFTPAGTYSIPASLTGNGFVVFKYEGANPGVTTTIQLDNITVN